MSASARATDCQHRATLASWGGSIQGTRQPAGLRLRRRIDLANPGAADFVDAFACEPTNL
jgi:hypothetical protein